MNNRERRFLQSDVVVQPGEGPKIVGYAAVFNTRSEILGDSEGSFVEEIDPGAFTECLANNPDIVGLVNHMDDKVLGRTTSKTMRVSVDETGLKYEIDPPDTSYANDLIVSMSRGDIKASSFGFVCQQDRWFYDKMNNQNVRRLMKVSIFDCSPVTNPAYKDASSQLRSLFPDEKGGVPDVITGKLGELRNSRRKEKRGRSVIGAVTTAKWAILPEKLETICAFLSNWSDGHVATKEQVQVALMGFDQQDEMDYRERNDEDATQASSVAVIPMFGTIGQRMTMMTEFSGGCSCESLTKAFRAALADDTVKSIVFDIDSPGGTVTGVPELAAEILAARGQKPIIAVANGMAASAAIWLATAADEVVVIPSGSVGSIGVYCAHQDVSAAMEKAGVSVTFVKAGKYKTEGNSYAPLSDSAIAYMQKGVDETYQDFLEAVAAGRGVTTEKVESDFGQGRMLSAKDALAAGLVDRIATMDEVVSALIGAEATVASEMPFEQPVDSGVEASAVKADDDTCSCDCPECVNGDHDECTGDDGDCDWDDDNEAKVIASPTEAVVQTPEQIEEAARAAHEFDENLKATYKVRLMSLL